MSACPLDLILGDFSFGRDDIFFSPFFLIALFAIGGKGFRCVFAFSFFFLVRGRQFDFILFITTCPP